MQWHCDAPRPTEPEAQPADTPAAQLLRLLRTNEAGLGLHLTSELEAALSKLMATPARTARAVNADALALLAPIVADARCSVDVRCVVLRAMVEAGLDHPDWLGAYTLHDRPGWTLPAAGIARASDAPLIESHGPYTVYALRTPELERQRRLPGGEHADSSVYEYMRLCVSMTLELDSSRLSQSGAEQFWQARLAVGIACISSIKARIWPHGSAAGKCVSAAQPAGLTLGRASRSGFERVIGAGYADSWVRPALVRRSG